MDTVEPARFLLATFVVLGLIGLMALGLRRAARAGLGTGLLQPGPGATGRLSIVETRFLDARRRLVLVRRDDREHLLLLTGDRELLIESCITAPAPAAEPPHA